jgi:hypothetical protein
MKMPFKIISKSISKGKEGKYYKELAFQAIFNNALTHILMNSIKNPNFQDLFVIKFNIKNSTNNFLLILSGPNS